MAEAGKIQNLVWIGFNIKNLTEKDMAELYTIYQKSFGKGYISKGWTDSFLKPIIKPGKDHHKLN